MVDVRTEIVIQCPRDEAAAYTADPDRAPEWYQNIRSAEWRTPKPLQVGTRIAFKARFLGRELVYVYEVAEYVRSEKLVMRTAESPFPMETTYEWSDAGDGGTRMKLRNRGEPGAFFKLFAPLMAAAMRKANLKDLQEAKRILESRHGKAK